MTEFFQSQAQLDRWHPGPGAEYVAPSPRVETASEKLGRMEREYLELSLRDDMRDVVPRYLDLPSLARAITVQRAGITG